VLTLFFLTRYTVITQEAPVQRPLVSVYTRADVVCFQCCCFGYAYESLFVGLQQGKVRRSVEDNDGARWVVRVNLQLSKFLFPSIGINRKSPSWAKRMTNLAR
jgi:hypothetical protein